MPRTKSLGLGLQIAAVVISVYSGIVNPALAGQIVTILQQNPLYLVALVFVVIGVIMVYIDA